VFVLQREKVATNLWHARENDDLPRRLAKLPCLAALQQTAEELRPDEVVYRFRIVPDRAYEYIGPAASHILGKPAEAFYRDPDLALRLVVAEDRPLLEALLNDPSERSGAVFLQKE